MSDYINDFSQERVPDSQLVSSKHIALVIAGGTIAIPAFLMAAYIGRSLGFFGAIFAFIFGSLILGIMNACTSWVGSFTRLSASKLTENAFGYKGAKVINTLMAFTLAGWYGVNCKMFGEAANTVLTSFGIILPLYLYIIMGSGLMLWVSLKGFKGIDKLALWLVPLMLVFIFYAANKALTMSNASILWGINNSISFTSAISAVVGAYIVGVVIQPDYSRFAANPEGAAIGAGSALLIVFPLVLIFTSIPAIITQQSDLILVMVGLGIGVPAFLLLLLSSWSSNVLCLYSSSLSVNTVVPKLSLTHITILIGVLGTVIAFVDVQKYFVDFLILLGVTIPPIGAIYCLNFLFNKDKFTTAKIIENYHFSAIFSWLTGGVLGFLSYHNYISITGVPTLDSIFISLALYFIIHQLRYKYKRTVENYNL